MVTTAPTPGRSAGSASPTVIDVLRRFAPLFLKQQRVPATVQSTLETVLTCRTAARGGFRYTCDDCGYTAVLYGSCGSRYCSQCQGARRHAWADNKARLLLPVEHFQVVTTLPSELRSLARQFPREVYDAMFTASHQMLRKLADTRWQAVPAILAVLHTWTRDLRFHPHVHCVISAGGLTEDDGWVSAGGRYLFPVKAMSRLWRGLFLSELTRKDLPLDKPQRIALRRARAKAARKSWVVHVVPAGGRDTQHLVKYLARYVYQNALSDHRVLALGEHTVTIRARGTRKVTLTGPQFLRRYVQHILPKRFRRIRQYGLLAPAARRRLALARELASHAPRARAQSSPVETAADVAVSLAVSQRCPDCAAHLRVTVLPPVPPPQTARGPP